MPYLNLMMFWLWQYRFSLQRQPCYMEDPGMQLALSWGSLRGPSWQYSPLLSGMVHTPIFAMQALQNNWFQEQKWRIKILLCLMISSCFFKTSTNWNAAYKISVQHHLRTLISTSLISEAIWLRINFKTKKKTNWIWLNFCHLRFVLRFMW